MEKTGENYSKIEDRIKKIRSVFCDNSNANFAKMIGKSPHYASQLCTGASKPGRNMLDTILRVFPSVSRQWLFFGDGDMYVSSADNYGDIHDNKVGGDLLGNGAIKNDPAELADLTDLIMSQQRSIERLIEQNALLTEMLKNNTR